MVEFKEQVVKCVYEVGVGLVVCELGLVVQMLCNWLKFMVGGGQLMMFGMKFVIVEEMELLWLCVENVWLKMYVEILKKVMVYFVKDVL